MDTKPDVRPVESTLAFADVRDELEALALSRHRQLRRLLSWSGVGALFLLWGAMAGAGPLLVVAFLCLLFAAPTGRSYMRNLARRRELRERLRSLHLSDPDLPPPEL